MKVFPEVLDTTYKLFIYIYIYIYFIYIYSVL